MSMTYSEVIYQNWDSNDSVKNYFLCFYIKGYGSVCHNTPQPV